MAERFATCQRARSGAFPHEERQYSRSRGLVPWAFWAWGSAMNDASSFPTDYDEYAATYAWARRAVPWIVSPLARIVGALPADTAVLEIGCGTGNYIRALAESRSGLVYAGFDLSEPMLQEARGWRSNAAFVHGDAAKEFPFPNERFALAF